MSQSNASSNWPLPTPAGKPYRGLWYGNQRQTDGYGWKYSGGLATYPQQILPIALYAPEVRRTFFCYCGADANGKIENTLSYYDHDTETFGDPLVVLRRDTWDAHYQTSLAIAPDGHILVFCNSHGVGIELPKSDPTYGKAYILRSRSPFDITAFDCILEDNFSYSQVWSVNDGKLVWLHTRYEADQEGKAVRPLYVSNSADGITWSPRKQVTDVEKGSYQVSWTDGKRVAMIFDYHPEPVGLNARTNLYYLESWDAGATWTNCAGEGVALPLTEPKNAALVRDFAAEGLLVYVKDLDFDVQGNPWVLVVTSHGCWSGPSGGPRELLLGHFNGKHWSWSPICAVDHNYDHGSLWVQSETDIEIVFPSGPGSQPFTTGGDLFRWTSNDGGQTWQSHLIPNKEAAGQQTYVRKVLNAHPDFHCLWASADALEPSPVRLHFADKQGNTHSI